MARMQDHAQAIKMRLEGKSYSEIKTELKVSKSTLSYWLRDYPLSPEDLVRLRDKNPRRIESFRATMQKKRDERLKTVYEKVSRDLSLNYKKGLLVSGFFLYWAEGSKTRPYSIMMANTDPAILVFFLEWIQLLGWKREDVKVRLQLYADMDPDLEVQFWKKRLDLPMSCFRSPYIKKTNRAMINYKGGFGHGTCNIIIDNRDLGEYVHMGITFLRERFVISR